MSRYRGNHDIKNFPSLDPEEFAEACHYLQLKYCRASLGPLRKRWKLRLHRSLATDGLFTSASDTYIQITRPLEPCQQDDLSLDLVRGLSISDGSDTIPQADEEMLFSEEADAGVLAQTSPAPNFGSVSYEIHLHPTYQVPCLWFTLRDLPVDEPAFDIETVFRRLVPDEHKATLRNGFGISVDHHPMTGLPSFFVHPCLLGDAISNFECSIDNYLMVWLGLVGGCVSLWVPTEMAAQ